MNRKQFPKMLALAGGLIGLTGFAYYMYTLIPPVVSSVVDDIKKAMLRLKFRRREYYGVDMVMYEKIVSDSWEEIWSLAVKCMDELNIAGRKKEGETLAFAVWEWARELIAEENTSLQFKGEKGRDFYKRLIEEYDDYQPTNHKYSRVIKDCVMEDLVKDEFDAEWEDVDFRPDLQARDEILTLKQKLMRLRLRCNDPHDAFVFTQQAASSGGVGTPSQQSLS